MKRAALTTLLAVFLAPTIALAHTGQGETSGLVHGFIHPLTGSDHARGVVQAGGRDGASRRRSSDASPLNNARCA